MARTVPLQPLLGVEEEALHAGVEERVEHRRPGTSDVVRVRGQLPRDENGDDAEQVAGVQPQERGLDVLLPPGCVLPDERDDEAAGALLGQVIDAGHQPGVEVVGGAAGVERGDAVAEQRSIQVAAPGLSLLHPPGQGRVIGEEPEPWALTLNEGVRALGRRVADIVALAQQFGQVRVPVDHLGRLLKAVEETLAEVEGRGQRLGEPDPAGVCNTDVRQSPAIVDVDQPWHLIPSPSCDPCVSRG